MDLIKPSFLWLMQQLSACQIQEEFSISYPEALVQHSQQIYSQIPQSAKVLLTGENSAQFLSSFLAGVGKGCPIFLGNHQWQSQEWKQVFDLVQPDLMIQEKRLEQIASSSLNIKPERNIMISTGGSSGKIRFVKHNWETLSASVTGFCRYFEQKRVNCFCILPLYHVSGLMQFMRTFLTKGSLILYPYKRLEKAWQNQDLATLHELENITQNQYFLSLVPTQLQRLLNLGAGNWLSQFKAVLLGGAPPWQSLLVTARQYQIPIALTYGMTETASQVVTLNPDDFLGGNNSVGRVLPHAKIIVQGESGEELAVEQVGTITIQSQSLGLGYYSYANWKGNRLITDDLGYFDPAGYLYIVGRKSRKIITGGENVFPDEVEAAILSTGLVIDVYVMGVEDQNWGEVVSVIYVPQKEAVTSSEIERQLKQTLSSYKIPKQWLAVTEIPRNEQGKVAQSRIEKNQLFSDQ